LPRVRLFLACLLAAPALVAEPASLVIAQAYDPGRAMGEARTLELEEEVRRLTGRVEELEYRQKQLTERMDRLVGAVDQRLSAVEPGNRPSVDLAADSGANAPSPPPLPAVPPAPTGPAPRRLTATEPPAPPPPPVAETPDVSPDASAARGYVLGTIPRDTARNIPVRPPDSAVGYDEALALLQNGRWAEAEKAFSAFLESNPNDPRASSAAFWLGETYYFRGDYQAAAASFARNYRSYGPDAPKAPDNLLKLGMALAQLGDKTKACQTYAELGKRHPNAPAPVRQTLARERSNAGCA
jgi:tol-pal system protein YbgF